MSMRAALMSGRCRDNAVRADRIANEVSRTIDRVVRVPAARNNLEASAGVERHRHAANAGPSFDCRWSEVDRRVNHYLAEARQARKDSILGISTGLPAVCASDARHCDLHEGLPALPMSLPEAKALPTAGLADGGLSLTIGGVVVSAAIAQCFHLARAISK